MNITAEKKKAKDAPHGFLKDCQFFLLSYTRDGIAWYDEVAQYNFVPRVMQILGGRWERESSYDPMISAFFAGDKRVLVIGFPPAKGWTLEKAQATLDNIRENREDLS